MKDVRQIKTPPRLPKRRRDAHKGDFGRVLVIGGSRGMIGAPALVANAALRSGAGLVTVACPRSIQLAVATLCPCATTMPLPEDDAGRLAPRAALQQLRKAGLLSPATAPTVLAAGPGLGRGDARFDRELLSLFDAFRNRAGVPAVLDADALYAMRGICGASQGRRRNASHARTIITPHPGEMAGLWGVSSGDVQGDRKGVAIRTARALSAGIDSEVERPVVVLKGHRTVVTDGVRIWVNQTGNPGMATGGSGDVLTGVIAALVAQKMSLLDAAVLGVHLHGCAGDIAATQTGPHGLIATDLIEHLPVAFQRHARR